MNALTSAELFLPPSPFRLRVVDGLFWKRNELRIRSIFEYVQRGMGRNPEHILLAEGWRSALDDLAREGKVPKGKEPLSIFAEMGVLFAAQETSLPFFGDKDFPYLIHACMSIICMHEDLNQKALNTLALDGGSYLYRTKTPVEELKQSVAKAL